MRNGNEESLGNVISQLLKDYHLDEGLLEIRIQEAWSAMMDHSILQRTASVRFEKGVLKIKTTSSALAHELSYQAEDIRTALNTVIRSNVIEKVEIR
jgi:hypothetical protein